MGLENFLYTFLSGCDFLPAIYNMPFKRMLAFTMSVVCQVGLFTSPILALDARGRWIGGVGDGVKLLAACYFQLHRNVFMTAVSSAADMFAQSSQDVKIFCRQRPRDDLVGTWSARQEKLPCIGRPRIARQEGSFCYRVLASGF